LRPACPVVKRAALAGGYRVRVTDISRVSSSPQAHWRRIGSTPQRSSSSSPTPTGFSEVRRQPQLRATLDDGLIQTRRDDDDRRPLAPGGRRPSALISSKPSIFGM